MKMTYDRLTSLLDYQYDTGEFTWKQRTGAKNSGDVAGCFVKDRGKYNILITIDGKLYRAHVLAWFYYNRKWPEERLVHIDGRQHNNAIANLAPLSAIRKPNVTQDELKSKLQYNKYTGEFKWKSTANRARSGKIAGRIVKSGTAQSYYVITINGKQYNANRLAWLYMYGVLPVPGCITHVNRNRLDNSICNLHKR